METKKKSENYNNLKVLTIVMLLTSVFFLTFGLTYAFYRNFLRGTTNNIIEAGHLSFHFDENRLSDSGIYLADAFPISDDAGKRLSGNREYFDFSVSSMSLTADISYQVYAVKQPTSTLSNDWVKIYLTLKDGTKEVPSSLVMNNGKVKSFSELNGDSTTKLVYTGVASQSSEEYIQNFRLRMWIGDNVSINDQTWNELNNKTFTVKVKVTANQE